MPVKTNKPETKKKKKKTGNGYDLEFGSCEAGAEESDGGRKNGVIRVGR